MLARATDNTSCCNLSNGDMLKEVTVKISLERINTQERITVEVLLDSEVTRLVMSLEFARKQGFKLKKLDRHMYIRNMDGLLNKEGPIKHTVEVLGAVHTRVEVCRMCSGCSKEKGKEYDNMIGCTVVVSVSALYSRCYDLALFSHFPHVILLICLVDCILFPHSH